MAARQSTYLPPRAVNQKLGAPRSAPAATALDLLSCNPDSLLSRPLGGRLSAAKLARQRYEEALGAKASGDQVQGDLLEFDSPKAAPAAPPSSDAALASTAPPPDVPATAGQIGGVPGTLWPGDTVMARYGPGGSFFRARVVRVYSNRGCSLVDVEWMRAQEAGPNCFDCLGAGFDESWHRNGLQVGVDVFLPAGGGSAPSNAAPPARALGSCASPAPPPALVPASVSSSSSLLPDLLDLTPNIEVQPTNCIDVQGVGMPGHVPFGAAPPTMLAGQLPLVGQLPVMPAPGRSPTAPSTMGASNYGNGSPAGAYAANAATASGSPGGSQDRFNFVSDIIFQAADAQAPGRL
eukprot:TRINITY_DN69961_c0_g1_i1.p1 TRINITY_DN69961_c0_g1~~TRINITY_DN69961_c0_g1_i1.p1  ORF type:complete len:350 (+),score=56.22 TRINITY_DN69961_c0_g1_i1:101-1150(+)